MSDANIVKMESKIGDLENEQGFINAKIDSLMGQINDLRDRHEQIPGEIYDLNKKICVEPFDEPV